MDTCPCQAKEGYQFSTSNDSWNRNDQTGMKVMLLIVLILILLIYISVTSLTKQSLYTWLAMILLFSVILLNMVIRKPIYLLYAPSSILSYFIRTPPYLDRAVYFPNHTMFEHPDTFTKIKQEVEYMLNKTNSGNNLPMTHDSYGGENQYIGSDIKVVQGVKRAWRLLNVKVGNMYSEDALQHFPVLVGLLNNLPEVQSCVVSVLEPGIQIPIHVGYYKGIMRYMIPTHIPKDRENVYLCVNGTKYHWKEGEGVLWDDTYPHKVYNNTNEVRVLIYMDVVRPLHHESISWFHKVNHWILKTASGSSIVKDEIKRTEKQISIS